MTPRQLTIIRQMHTTYIVLIVIYFLGRPTGETGRNLEVSSKCARA